MDVDKNVNKKLNTWRGEQLSEYTVDCIIYTERCVCLNICSKM